MALLHKPERVSVIGAGSWGTALAKLVADQGHHVCLWARRQDLAASIAQDKENKRYLAGYALPTTLRATHDIGEALDGATVIFSVVPTTALREVWTDAKSLLKDQVIMSATKGIENGTLKLVSGIFEDIFPNAHERMTYLGGPSFAKEVAAQIPTAVSVAGKSERAVEQIQSLLSTDRFRVYTTDDVVGIELGGALKNVIAIAAGVSDGLGFGHNSRAALITRGLAEINRLGMHMGAHPLTLAGLGGMGDLVLTCTGDLSRNRTVGLELGRGKKLPQILSEMTMVAEGVKTSKSAHELATKENVEMPITHLMHKVLYEDLSPMTAVQEIMMRKSRKERD